MEPSGFLSAMAVAVGKNATGDTERCDRVTVGHGVMLHGCTIGDGTLIGIQAVVLNNSVIGKDCLVGAGAVIIENKSFADRSVIFGSPAKAVREVSEDNVTRMRMSAEDYVKRGVQYKKELKRIG